MAGIQKVCLNNLNSNISNALIVAIVIAKQSPRLFTSKVNKKNESRGVTSFTLRDSEVDVINCDCWGSDYFVTTYYENFQVGDVVEIISPKILVKDHKSELFKPVVSSPFFLTVNEGQAEISIHTCEQITFATFQTLLHLPTKPSSGYYGLADVLKISDPGPNTFVDLLVVVKSVGAVRNIKTKSGVDMAICTVEVLDNTTPTSIPINIFEKDLIKRANEWRPLESVLFISDARLSNRGCNIQIVGKSVVTHQPHTPDAETLRLYARSRTTAICPLISSSSNDVATVRQIKDRTKTQFTFTSTIVALMTRLDLDKISTNEAFTIEVWVRFADHTGELSARIEGHVLEAGLDLNPGDLMKLTADQRNGIRWRLLLERCCVQLSVYSSRHTVIGLRRTDENDRIPLY